MCVTDGPFPYPADGELMVIVTLAIVIYSIGIPVAYAAFMFKVRQKVMAEEHTGLADTLRRMLKVLS